jgi:hypothetical protein
LFAVAPAFGLAAVAALGAWLGFALPRSIRGRETRFCNRAASARHLVQVRFGIGA